MNNNRILTFGRSERWPDSVLSDIAEGHVLAVQIPDFLADGERRSLVSQLSTLALRRVHRDVPGLDVLGLSHFQAARSEDDFRDYFDTAETRLSWLSDACAPSESLHDRIVAYMEEATQRSVERLHLPSEGTLAPFTVRIFDGGVGIEPHQDVLAAESPTDPIAAQIAHQYSLNVYLECPASGGEIVLDQHIGRRPEYVSLEAGPVSAAEESLREVARLLPSAGSLVLMSSYRLHSVAPVALDGRRVTFSFFLAAIDHSSSLWYWA